MNRKSSGGGGKPGRTSPRPRFGGGDQPVAAGPLDDGPPAGGRRTHAIGPPAKTTATNLRIIGGDLRGRTIRYHGDRFTRPMKDNIRENVFNILGQAVRGAICFDLFAGTGALAIESISRGASVAIAVEQSKPAALTIRQSGSKLDIDAKLRVIQGDTFRLAPRLLGPPADDTPWIVYLCPPYAMWDDVAILPSLHSILTTAIRNAPPGSVIVVETDKRTDPSVLPQGPWDLRTYGNVRLGFLEPAMTCGMSPD